MKVKKYNNFHDFIINLQHKVHVLLAFPVLAFILLFVRIENSRYHPFISNKDLLYLMRSSMLILTLSIIILSVIYFSFQMNKIRKLTGLRDKLNRYYLVSTIRDYLLATLLVLNLGGMVLTGDRFYTIFFSISLIVMLSGYPSHSRIINSLKLNPEESQKAMSQDTLE